DLELGLGGGEGFSQLDKGITAGKSCEQQAVGLERPTDLDERARKIVDELQRKRGYDEIDAGVAKRQRLLVGGNNEICLPALATRWRACERVGRDQGGDFVSTSKRAAYSIGRRTEVDGTFKAAAHGRQSVRHFLRHSVEQKSRSAQVLGTRAVRAQQIAVEQDRQRGHRRPLWNMSLKPPAGNAHAIVRPGKRAHAPSPAALVELAEWPR